MTGAGYVSATLGFTVFLVNDFFIINVCKHNNRNLKGTDNEQAIYIFKRHHLYFARPISYAQNTTVDDQSGYDRTIKAISPSSENLM